MNEPVKKTRIFFIFPILFVFYYLLGLSGYGSYCNTYMMIRAGRNLILQGIYFPSRQPGYLIPEIVIGWSSLIGAHYLSNLISALFGAGVVYIFWRILREKFSASTALLIALIAGLNPYFIISASSSMDDAYSLFFALAGILLLIKRKELLASLTFSLAISSRLPAVLLIGIAYLYFMYKAINNKDFRALSHLIISGILTTFLATALFVPIYLAYGRSFWFLHYKDAGPFTFFGHLVRFVYKNIYLFGLFPFIVLAGSILWKGFKRQLRVPLSAGLLSALAIIVAYGILFFYIPMNIRYILTLVFVIIPLWVFVCRPGKIALSLLLALTIFYGFVVNVDILDVRYNEAGNEAIAADVGIFLRPGVIIKDIKARPEAAKYFFSEYNIKKKARD